MDTGDFGMTEDGARGRTKLDIFLPIVDIVLPLGFDIIGVHFHIT